MTAPFHPLPAPEPLHTLVLLDIDGTLLDCHRAGTRSLLAALRQIFDTEVTTDGYSMAGRTDAQIVMELAERGGVERSRTAQRLDAIFDAYVTHLERELVLRAPTCHPGVPALVQSLAAREDVLLGLLTGNVERGARAKLGRVGLYGAFRLGAFGDQATCRNDLPAVAIARARQETGRIYAGEEVVIVGDTPADIQCAQGVGARSVAVATGPYDVDALRSHGPTHVLADLSDTEAALAAILPGASGGTTSREPAS